MARSGEVGEGDVAGVAEEVEELGEGIGGEGYAVKAKLRRAARYLQGNDSSYYSRPAELEAIRLLYRLASGVETEVEGK